MSRKFLTSVDLAQNQLLNPRAQNLASAPSSPAVGQFYFDTTLQQYGVYTTAGWAYMGSGGGTVTSVSVASANGFGGSVATSTTTPAITLTTSVTGLLKGNGTGVSAAAAGTDYLAPNGSGAALTGIGVSQVSGAAPLASPALTGAPTAPTPTTSTGIANKGYVDSAVQGISAKYTAAAATTGAETYTIASGSVTQVNGTTIDGVSPNVGDYVLVMSAPAASGAGTANVNGTGTSQPANGLYQVTSNTTNLSLSRASDMSGSNSPFGAYVYVAAGTAMGSGGYSVAVPSTSAAFTYGSGNIQWSQFCGVGDPVAGTGLAKSGNTLSIENGGVLLPAHGGTGAASLSGLIKGNGASAATAAVAGTDYAAATTGSSVLKGNGAGGFSSAKYAAAIGDGSSTSITVTHNLGTQDVIVQVYDASTYVQYECDVTRTSTSVVTLGFATAPASGALRVVVIG